MRTACLAGWRIALRRWPVMLALFGSNLVAGLIFAGIAAAWLSSALDASLATRTLLTDLDMNVFVDLLANHGDTLQLLLVGGGFLAVVLALVGVGLNALAVVAVNEDGSLRDCVRRSVDVYSRYVLLAALTAVVYVVGILGVSWLGRALTHWTADSSSEMLIYWLLGAAAAGAALGGLFCTTVHDHARIHCVATGSGALRSYWWALAYVAGREWRAFPLTLVLGSLGLTGWAGYQSVGMLIHTHDTFGLTLSLVWGELFLLGRMLLRVWTFAAESELQMLSERGAGS